MRIGMWPSMGRPLSYPKVLLPSLITYNRDGRVCAPFSEAVFWPQWGFWETILKRWVPSHLTTPSCPLVELWTTYHFIPFSLSLSVLKLKSSWDIVSNESMNLLKFNDKLKDLFPLTLFSLFLTNSYSSFKIRSSHSASTGLTLDTEVMFIPLSGNSLRIVTGPYTSPAPTGQALRNPGAVLSPPYPHCIALPDSTQGAELPPRQEVSPPEGHLFTIGQDHATSPHEGSHSALSLSHR